MGCFCACACERHADLTCLGPGRETDKRLTCRFRRMCGLEMWRLQLQIGTHSLLLICENVSVIKKTKHNGSDEGNEMDVDSNIKTHTHSVHLESTECAIFFQNGRDRFFLHVRIQKTPHNDSDLFENCTHSYIFFILV